MFSDGNVKFDVFAQEHVCNHICEYFGIYGQFLTYKRTKPDPLFDLTVPVDEDEEDNLEEGHGDDNVQNGEKSMEFSQVD